MVNNTNISTTDDNLVEYVIDDDNIKDFSEIDYSTLDVAEMPVIFEDSIIVGEETEVQENIEVISEEKAIYIQKKTHDLKKVQLWDKLKIKRPKYYKNDEEILKDLMDTTTDSN